MKRSFPTFTLTFFPRSQTASRCLMAAPVRLALSKLFSAVSIVCCADAAVKAANISLLRVHVAMAIGGKGFMQLTGDVASVTAAVDAGKQVASDLGILVATSVIASPDKALFPRIYLIANFIPIK